MHSLLARLYTLSGILAALCIVLITAIVVCQVILNAITKIGSAMFAQFPALAITSYSDFAGYLLVGASFLALPYAFYNGGHIRVSLLLQVLGRKKAFFLELWATVLCTAVAASVTYYTFKMTYASWRFGDVSTGIIPIPLWIPQSVMTFGLAVFTIALIDAFVQLLTRRTAPYIENAHDELSAE